MKSKSALYIVLASFVAVLCFTVLGVVQNSSNDVALQQSTSATEETTTTEVEKATTTTEATTTTTEAPAVTLVPETGEEGVEVVPEVISRQSRTVEEAPLIVPEELMEPEAPRPPYVEVPLTISVPGGFPEEHVDAYINMNCSSSAPGGHTSFPSYQDSVNSLAMDGFLFTFQGYSFEGLSVSCTFSHTPSVTMSVNGSTYRGGTVTSTSAISVVAAVNQ